MYYVNLFTRWRLVVHGAIDGFSHYITYLRCSTNNKSKTVRRLFRSAIRECGVPTRIRTDRGGGGGGEHQGTLKGQQ